MRRLLGSVLLALQATSSARALAEDVAQGGEPKSSVAAPEVGGSFSLAVLAGYRMGPESGPGEVIGSGRVYGLRAGSLSSSRLYLGTTFTTHRHGSDGIDRMDAVTGDFELGFDVVPGAFDLRPYLGLGLLVAVFEDNSGITPHGSLGTLAQYHFGIATLGAELRCEGAHQSALSLLASVGIAL